MALRRPPFVFTEHGVSLVDAFFGSPKSDDRAVQLNILIIRAFVRLREHLATNKDLARKLEDIERTQQEHSEHLQKMPLTNTLTGFSNLRPRNHGSGQIGFATTEEPEE